jgi:hypothetical protein
VRLPFQLSLRIFCPSFNYRCMYWIATVVPAFCLEKFNKESLFPT